MRVSSFKPQKQLGESIFVQQTDGGGDTDFSANFAFGEVNISNEAFTGAVEDSIFKSGLFKQKSANFNSDWGLKVIIYKVRTQNLYFVMQGGVTAKYSVYYKNNLAYEFVETTKDVANMIFRFSVGNGRKASVEGAAQKNIQAFLKRIANYDFSDITESSAEEKTVKKQKHKIYGSIFRTKGKVKIEIRTRPGKRIKPWRVYSVFEKGKVVGKVRIDQVFHTKARATLIRKKRKVKTGMLIGL